MIAILLAFFSGWLISLSLFDACLSKIDSGIATFGIGIVLGVMSLVVHFTAV